LARNYLVGPAQNNKATGSSHTGGVR
jgi:hypothetical protein